jgi:hypothetical protein
VAPAPPLRSDINGDGRVNCEDLSILKADFGKTGDKPPG